MNSTTPSLSQVAAETLRGARFSYALADFLDAFYRAPEAAALHQPPAPLAGQVTQGEVWDAFLGATGESLARRAGWVVPPWTATRDRFLARPYFPITAPPFRATLLLESPVEFRARNLFVTANALART